MLPVPTEWETAAAAWWTALLHKDDPRIHVDGRLPFWAPRPDGAPKVQALVVSAAPPDPSGADRSLLGLEVALEQSRARLAQGLTTAGFDAGTIVLRRDPGAGSARALVDVAGFVTEADPRLAALAFTMRPPIVLGAYAVPDRRSRPVMTAPRPNPGILKIAPYVGGEARLEGVNRIIKLSSNEGAFGPPPAARSPPAAPPPRCTATPTAAATPCARRSAPGSTWTRSGSCAAPGRTSCWRC